VLPVLPGSTTPPGALPLRAATGTRTNSWDALTVGLPPPGPKTVLCVRLPAVLDLDPARRGPGYGDMSHLLILLGLSKRSSRSRPPSFSTSSQSISQSVSQSVRHSAATSVCLLDLDHLPRPGHTDRASRSPEGTTAAVCGVPGPRNRLCLAQRPFPFSPATGTCNYPLSKTLTAIPLRRPQPPPRPSSRLVGSHRHTTCPSGHCR
jgi:hypothetical protein